MPGAGRRESEDGVREGVISASLMHLFKCTNKERCDSAAPFFVIYNYLISYNVIVNDCSFVILLL